MFTGLVEEMGWIERIAAVPQGRRIRVRAERVTSDARLGDSLAVNGCCLTAVAVDRQGFEAEVVAETLERTTLGSLEEGEPVNLERSLKLDQRLGGHLVQGHVDGRGEVRGLAPEGDGVRVTLGIPEGLARFVAEKGSLAVDGVSLTVARALGTTCEVALIPHTLKATIAGRYRPGQAVNLEVDLMARYLARLLDEAEWARRAG
ncbi:MAG TPA: riboflavin synthase [Candidatus Eisenbacteria bacterium]|jgi:riboflavin synthase